MRSKWVYMLVGNNNSGKTTIQKHLVESLTGRQCWDRLDSNKAYPIVYSDIRRCCREVLVGGRSYQELRDTGVYGCGSIKEYFTKKLDTEGKDVDFMVLASHLNITDIKDMVLQARQRSWKVCGMFMTNSRGKDQDTYDKIVDEIQWDECYPIENPETTDRQLQADQLKHAAETIVEKLVKHWEASEAVS